MDGIINTEKTDQEYLQNLHQILEHLRDYNTRAKITKCRFFKESVTYCGHRIDKQGLHKMVEKIEL